MQAVEESLVRYGTTQIHLELLDYVIVSFCKSLGDADNAIDIVQEQVMNEQIDYESLSMDNLMGLIKRLVDVTKVVKGPDAARLFRQDVLRAYSVCKNT